MGPATHQPCCSRGSTAYCRWTLPNFDPNRAFLSGVLDRAVDWPKPLGSTRCPPVVSCKKPEEPGCPWPLSLAGTTFPTLDPRGPARRCSPIVPPNGRPHFPPGRTLTTPSPCRLGHQRTLITSSSAARPVPITTGSRVVSASSGSGHVLLAVCSPRASESLPIDRPMTNE